MNLNIVEEKENKALERKEITFEVEGAKTTPQRKEIRKRIAALKNAKEGLVSIEKIEQAFGEHRAKGKAFVYSSEGQFKKLEPAYLAKREGKGQKEGEKAEEKPAEKKEEPPAGEGKKEEKAEPKEKEGKPAEKGNEKKESKETGKEKKGEK